MGTVDALMKLSPLAESQYGLITTAQANVFGVARRDLARLTSSGVLERTTQGVYLVAAAPRPRLVELRSAWLHLAPELLVEHRGIDHGVVSHESATLVHQVGDLNPFTYSFTVPPPRRMRSNQPGVVIHRLPLSTDEVEWADGLLVTTPRRTVRDLLLQTIDGDHILAVVHGYLDRKLSTTSEMTGVVAAFADRYPGLLPNLRQLERGTP